MKTTSFILWIMGPTSSGKTTLANHIMGYFEDADIPAIHYDGDEFRDLFGPSHSFDESSRNQVVDAIIHFAEKSSKKGDVVVVSALTASLEARQRIAGRLNNMVLCYIDCPIETCIERDPKGLYRKAIDGEIDTLVGYNAEYVPPENPDVTIETHQCEVEASTEVLVSYLRDEGYIPN